MSSLHDILARPFAKPEGLLGRLAARLMLSTNGPLADWAIELLELEPPDRVLEVGFGPGELVRRVAERVPDGRVAGIDVSSLMLEQATARNAEQIADGRVELHRGCVGALPFQSTSFDKVVTVNSIQFWPDVAQGLGQIRHVLRPGGRLVVVLLERRATTPAMIAEVRADLLAAIGDSGFLVSSSEIRPMAPLPAIAIVASRPSTGSFERVTAASEACGQAR